MRKRLASVALAIVAVGGFGVAVASSAEASTCNTTTKQVKVGDRTTTDSLRTCKLDRGGSSRTKTHKVSIKTAAGTVTDSRTESYSRTVSKKGKVSIRVSVKVCHKDAGERQVCTTNTRSS
jgi:hypothetical protein